MKQLRRDLRSFGAAAALRRQAFLGLERAGVTALHCITLREESTNRALLAPEAAYECRFLKEAELDAFSKDAENLLPADFVAEALARGAECYGILDGEALASFGWYSRGPIRFMTEFLVEFDPDWVYMYHGYTKPAYRGQRLHGVGITRCLQHYVGQGHCGIIGAVACENLASIRSARRMGFRRVGSVCVVGSGRHARTLSTAGALRHGFRVRRLSRRERQRPAEDTRPAATERALTLAEERRIMDHFAPRYEYLRDANAYSEREERRRFVDWSLAQIRAAGPDPGTLAFLDAGCGDGQTLSCLSQAGCRRLTGLDLSPGMLAQVRRRGPAGAQLVRGLAEELPFAPGSFDVVVASFLLHHMFEMRGFFESIQRLLAPGGWLFLLDVDAGSPTLRRERRRNPPWSRPLRAALARKNQAWLAGMDAPPLHFTPSHRLRSYAEIWRAIPDPRIYRLRRDSHGIFAAALEDLLSPESAFDRGLSRLLRRMDRSALAQGAGRYQWISARRRAAGPRA